MDAPGSQPPADEAQKRAESRDDLVRCYKRVFASEDGRRVLTDLFGRYGFDKNGVENDDFMPGGDGLTLARRDGMKSPLRYVMKMRNVELKPLGAEPRRAKAKS